MIVLILGVVAWGSDASAKSTSKQDSYAKATTWSEWTSVVHPPPLCGASMAYDAATGTVVLFGGSTLDSASSALSQTWLWSRTGWAEASPAQSPPARIYATMAYDPATKDIVLFGGASAANVSLGDTWTWNGRTWTEMTPSTSPSARESSASAYDPATKSIVLFGGWDGTTNLDDTWTWNGTAWKEQSPTASPPIRNGAAMAYDPATKSVVLFGGHSSAFLNDTWTWNGQTWARRSPATSPSARDFSMMAYDPATKLVVLFGGSTYTATSNTYYADTWGWSGTDWKLLSPAKRPPARRAGQMVYDPAVKALILYGGRGATTSLAETVLTSDTWKFGSESSEPFEAKVASWLKTSKASHAHSPQGLQPIAVPIRRDIHVRKAKKPPAALVAVMKPGAVPSFRSRSTGGQRVKASSAALAGKAAAVAPVAVLYLGGDYWTQVTTRLYYWTPTAAAWAPTYGFVSNATSVWTYDSTTSLWIGPTGEIYDPTTGVYDVTGLLYDPTTGNYTKTGFTFDPTSGAWTSETGSVWNPTSGVWTSPTGAVYSPTSLTWTLATGSVELLTPTTSTSPTSTVNVTEVVTPTVTPTTAPASSTLGGGTYGGGTYGGGTYGGGTYGGGT